LQKKQTDEISASDAPINGLVLRSAQGRENCAQFWIMRGGEMTIVKWVHQADGNWAWTNSTDVFGTAYVSGGKGCFSWSGKGIHRYLLRAKFDCAQDACLATEKVFPLEDEGLEEWFESKNGGYFWKGDRVVVYVRQAEPNHWYAVRHDGKVLGRRGAVVWFGTAVEACKAVHKERYTPTHPDPFAATDENWCWVKLPKKDCQRQA
jgi:hypothetical protein